MARTERSRVDFNINIKGVQDAQVLVKTLPKLIKQFDQLAAAMDKVEKAKGVSSTGKTKADAADRISRIELGVRKGDINNVKQLTANYASLVNQINALERAGAKTGAVQLRAYKMHQRLSDVISKRNAETRQLIRTQMDAAGSTDRMRGSLLDQIGSIKLSNQSLNQASQAVTQNAEATKHASFLLLNAGYLIQDSPYGIRGMANNISQLSQAYQMLAQRVQFLNQTQGSSITVWSSLTSLLKGPTGVILLIGSILPAALEVLSSNWDEWFGTTKEQNDELERTVDLINDYISTLSEIEDRLGSDPLGIEQMRKDIERLSDVQERVRPLEELRKRLEELETARNRLRRGSSFTSPATQKVIAQYTKSIEEVRNEIKGLEEDLGGLAQEGVYDKIQKNLDELQKDLDFNIGISEDDPLIRIEEGLSRQVERLQASMDLSETEGIDPLAGFNLSGNVQRQVDFYTSAWTSAMNEALSKGKFKEAELWAKYIRELNEVIESEGFEDLEMPDIEQEIISDPPDWEMFWKEQSFRANAAFEDAFTVDEMLKQLERKMKFDRELLDPGDVVGGLELFRSYWMQRQEILQRQRLSELEIHNQLRKQMMQSPDSFGAAIKNIEEYYATRREIIRESVKDEIELKKQLTQVDIEEANKKEETERQLQQKKEQLTQNYANFAISSGQAIANAMDASARAQFNINKIASASQAIINGYLAYTKTLAQGGFLAKPLATSALLLSFAQAGKIMSQSYDSARSTGGGGGINASYRGLSFANSYGDASQPFFGSSSVNSDVRPSNQSSSRPTTREIRIVDGFGSIVARGQEELDHGGGLDYMGG